MMFESINPIVILIAVAFVLLAFNSGYLYRKKVSESKIGSAEDWRTAIGITKHRWTHQ